MKTKCFSILLFLGLSLHAFGQSENQKSMQDWVYPYDVHKMQIADSLEIAYVDEGQGDETLLLVHGLGSYLKAWTKNIDVLRADYRCIALDLPGYGKSGKGDYAYSMTFFADAIRDFIQKMELDSVTLVGHSMGGQISMHVVLQEVPEIKKLVLVAPAGFETFTEAERQWFNNIYNAAFIKATPVDQIKRNFQVNFHNMPEDAQFMIEDRLYMRETIEYDAYCEMIPKCVQGMLQEPVFERLGDIGVPTLILYGANDLLIPNKLLHATQTTAQVAQSGHERIPDSELQMLDGCGHFVQWECAERVNEAIRAFVGK